MNDNPPITRSMWRRRRVGVGRPILAAGVALAAGLSIAACGGSSGSHPAASTGGSTAKYASCIRAHGVPEYPDSGDVKQTGTTAATVTVGGTPVSAKVFDAAGNACVKDSPGYIKPTKPSPALLANLTADMLKFSACVRAHGISDYPDQKAVAGPGDRGVAYVTVGRFPKRNLLTVPGYLTAYRKCIHFQHGLTGH